MYFAGKAERLKYVGLMIMGLGLIFYGMGLLSDGMKWVRLLMAFIESLRHIYTLAKRIAKTHLPIEVAGEAT